MCWRLRRRQRLSVAGLGGRAGRAVVGSLIVVEVRVILLPTQSEAKRIKANQSESKRSESKRSESKRIVSVDNVCRPLFEQRRNRLLGGGQAQLVGTRTIQVPTDLEVWAGRTSEGRVGAGVEIETRERWSLLMPCHVTSRHVMRLVSLYGPFACPPTAVVLRLTRPVVK